MVEVEVQRDGITLRRKHVNGGGAGGKGFDREIEPESGAGEDAAALLGAAEIGPAVRRDGPELLIPAGHLHVEIFPEIIRARDEAFWRTGAGTGRANDVGTIRIRELDLNDDSHKFGLIAMIESGLLGAVTGGVLAGLLDEYSERSEESDRDNVRTGFRRLQKPCVFVEESGHGFVTALAEEIGFADGLIGQGSVEGEGGGRKQQERQEYGKQRLVRNAHVEPLC